MKNKFLFYMMFLFLYLAIGTYYPYIIPYMTDTLGYSSSMASTIASLSPLLGIFMIPVWGMITDVTKKPKLILGISILGTIISLIFYANAKFYVWMFAINIIYNLFQRAFLPLSDNMGVSFAKESNAKYSVIRSFGSFGFILGSYVGAFILEHFAPNSFLYVFIGALVVAGVFLMMTPHLKIEETERAHLLTDLPKLIRNPEYVKVVSIFALNIGLVDSAFTFNSTRLLSFGAPASLIPITVLLMVIPEVLLMIKVDDFIEKTSHRFVLLIASSVALLRYILIALFPNLHLFVGLELIHGLVVAFTVPTAIEYIKMVTPDNLSATAIAFAGLCSSILLSIVVFVSGFIIDYLGLGMIYYFFAILALINVLITIRTENEKTTNK